MTFRREMLQVARLAPKMLGDSAGLVGDFVRSQWNADGGVRDRAGVSDLYYAVFGLECLQAIQQPMPDTTAAWLRTFGDGSALDFVHRCCLARAWAIVDRASAPTSLADGVQAFRSTDGGFAQRPGEAIGNAYAAYLALGALQDLGADLPPAVEVLASVEACRSRDGGYANHPGGALGTTPTTVAARGALADAASLEIAAGQLVEALAAGRIDVPTAAAQLNPALERIERDLGVAARPFQSQPGPSVTPEKAVISTIMA